MMNYTKQIRKKGKKETRNKKKVRLGKESGRLQVYEMQMTLMKTTQ